MRKEPPQSDAQGFGGLEDGEHEVDFEVNFGADLEWIDGRFVADLRSTWGPFLNPAGCCRRPR